MLKFVDVILIYTPSTKTPLLRLIVNYLHGIRDPLKFMGWTISRTNRTGVVGRQRGPMKGWNMPLLGESVLWKEGGGAGEKWNVVFYVLFAREIIYIDLGEGGKSLLALQSCSLAWEQFHRKWLIRGFHIW